MAALGLDERSGHAARPGPRPGLFTENKSSGSMGTDQFVTFAKSGRSNGMPF